MAVDGYYRYPTIHKEYVVFVCEDDLWTVPVRGGVARRLTANLGLVSHPALSPDGRRLAFVGREEGELEVYVMQALGGPATRLTYLGGNTTVLGWTPDGQRIIFASNIGQPFSQLTPLYTISPDGGEPEPLPYGPARSVSFGPQGGVVIGRRANDLANWKRYRGGTAGDLWIDREGRGEFEPLLELEGNLASPMWLGDRVYFLSDHEGIGNLYSCDLGGQDVRRHTHFDDYYVRNVSTDGRRFVYRAGADLYLFDPAKEEAGAKASKKIKVQFHSPQVPRNRRFVKASAYMDHYSLSPAGGSLALTARGKPFALSNWEGAVVQYGEAQGVRYRLVEWLNDGRRLVMISDATGEETIEIHSSPNGAGHRVDRLEGYDIGRPLFLSVSPQEDGLVLGNHRYELIYVDLERKGARLLDKSDYGRITGNVDWSPDGRWVVYSFKTSLHTAAIKLCQVETGETYYVTPPQAMYDFDPSFDPAGSYIYFLSFREFDPVRDSYYFDLNFPRGSRPYLVTLQRDLPDPFVPLPDEPEGPPADKPEENRRAAGKPDETGSSPDEPAGTEGEQPPEPAEAEQGVRIDLEGIQTRVTAFPVTEGRFQQIRGISGKVLFTSFPVEGSLGQHWLDDDDDDKGALEMYDLAERKREFIAGGVSGFEVSRDRKFLAYRAGKRLRVLKTGEKPDGGASGYTKKSGWIDLGRVRVAVSPPEEWQQMFREAWRLQRDHFWTEDMSQLDWQEVFRRYFRLIERVSTRSEFSDLMWEMQGELGTSHAYELGGDYRPGPYYQQGFLGADFEYDPETDGYRIRHVVQGDPWAAQFDSPLNRLGANIRPGDVLLAIDGQRLSREVSPGRVLVNRAGVEVQLTITANGRDPAESEELRTVLVKTLRSETRARYREWVERNRQQVHQATGGRVGYVHVPDMGAYGYAEFHRYYLAESEREGLIVDVRFNGGGSVSQLLLEKLARRRIGYDKPRYGRAIPYPFHSVLGPLVALTNEYAGSDGDIFSHAFKIMGLGPLIGKRTWGGVIGIWPRHSLVDGTYTTQPEFSYWFEDVGWNVENYGVNPDIEVEVRPQDYAAGHDPQLERALAEIDRLMAANPPHLPEFGPPPSRALPQLPRMGRGQKR